MACKGYRVFHYFCGQCHVAGYSVCKAIPNNSNIPKNTLRSVQEEDDILADIKFLLLILFLFSKQRVSCWAVLILKVHTFQMWKRALLPTFQGTCNYGGAWLQQRGILLHLTQTQDLPGPERTCTDLGRLNVSW